MLDAGGSHGPHIYHLTVLEALTAIPRHLVMFVAARIRVELCLKTSDLTLIVYLINSCSIAVSCCVCTKIIQLLVHLHEIVHMV
jgi:hypothetical protein